MTNMTMLLGPRPGPKYVTFKDGGGVAGRPKLVPLSKTPRSDPKLPRKIMSPRRPNAIEGSPRKPAVVVEASPRINGEMTWRPARDGLMTEDLKEKLRPVLDQRMPTLVTKGSPADNISAIQTGRSGLSELLDSPPRSMRDVRASINREVKTLTKKLLRLERAYYGERGNINNEVEGYVYSIKMLMKSLMVFDLNHASGVDDLIALASNPVRYKGEPKYLADLKEIYTKVQTFMPDKLTDLIDTIQILLNTISRYCICFYQPDTDVYLETADHYSEQITTWKEKAEVSVQSARSLYKRFKTAGITLRMLSSPVASFSSRNSLQRVLFLVLFADACTHLRNALEVIKSWAKADENYATYVKNDLTELDGLREEKAKNLRDFRQRCHSLTFKLAQLETEYGKLAVDVMGLRDKDESLKIEEVYLVNQIGDMEREVDMKERRRDTVRRQTPIFGPAPSPEPQAESVESLSSEIKMLRDQLPFATRQLAAVRTKLGWVDEKMSHLDKVGKEIMSVKKELKTVEQDRVRREKEFSEVDRAVSVARRVLMCKTANDSVEKLYYSMSVEVKAAKVTKAKDDPTKDPVDRACRIISNRIDRDWVTLYRTLHFHPQRGSETIGRDIVDLSESGSRVSSTLVARRSLDRWRRYHTRASVDDLRQALKKIKRIDILKVVDLDLNPPPKVIQAPCEIQEEAPPPVEPHLLPFYKQIERYDQLQASRLAAEKAAAARRLANAAAAAAAKS